jgi:hypothetical protein
MHHSHFGWLVTLQGVREMSVTEQRVQNVAENDRKTGLHNHYPGGVGLATSPGRRARLRFHSPVLRLTRRRYGLA